MTIQYQVNAKPCYFFRISISDMHPNHVFSALRSNVEKHNSWLQNMGIRLTQGKTFIAENTSIIKLTYLPVNIDINLHKYLQGGDNCECFLSHYK